MPKEGPINNAHFTDDILKNENTKLDDNLGLVHKHPL